jgi:hypothetical protein
MTDEEFQLVFGLEPKDQLKEYTKTNLKECYDALLKKDYQKAYRINRYKNDINFRLEYILRTRFRQTLKNNSKSKHTLELLGCSVEDLKVHLEKQFSKGMSWSNYGKWHIDHVRPCSSFDLSKPEEQALCFHYTNLQPLWAADNLAKSNKRSF